MKNKKHNMPRQSPLASGLPKAIGLYDPRYEKDSCGVGFVAHIKGQKSHQIVLDANQALLNMEHRGACGCEANTGDGAGILTALPHDFFKRIVPAHIGVDLPEPGEYGVGNVFLPTEVDQRKTCIEIVNRVIKKQGQRLLGWRDVPTDPAAADIGPTARASEPVTQQVFIVGAEGIAGEELERQLYIIRKEASRELRLSPMSQAKGFYFCTLSSKVIVYKGQLKSDQVMSYYPDLSDSDYTSHLAMVHSRFSTNTFPSWDRAQPNRFMSHNGEINTLRGNINWMRAREGVVTSDLFKDELPKIFPVVAGDCSDSGTFDNVLEFLLMTGRTLQEAVMMMIPEAWQNHGAMPEYKRQFYEYHSCLMEPWDGPASIAFTDGHYIGAVLDRNGLRPSRYYLTHDDRVIMASEAGVLPVAPELVKYKGRLQPGKIFLVDFEQGRIIGDEELKKEIASERPYGNWLRDERIEISDLKCREVPFGYDPDTLMGRLRAFGYTIETLQFMLIPMIQVKKDPIGSMGNDAALACLSDQPRLVYDYFKQLFAQVTNPAIDSIREEIIMSLECYVGPEANLLNTTEANAHRLLVPHPILNNGQLTAIKHMDHRGWKTKTIDITWDKSDGKEGMKSAIQNICKKAESAIDDGFSMIVLSDREIGPERVPVPALLACSAVHQHLIRQVKRTRLGIVLESGEAREVHHHCLLIGFGVDAINPYTAFESLQQCRDEGFIEDSWTEEKIVKAYRTAVAKGMLKVMAKMGISTLASYKGAQIFEAVGIDDEVIDACFTNTASRIQGVGFDVLAQEALRRHKLGYPTAGLNHFSRLPNAGEFHWRSSGEKHAWHPETIATLQEAAIFDNGEAYSRFRDIVNTKNRHAHALRGLLNFKPLSGGSVPLDEVESAKEIVRRFCTGAMSFGSISAEAHESLAIAMNRLGGKSNTGEGGEDYARFKPLPSGDSKRSAIKQVASGRFGVTSWYLTNADELQIKIAQGAKPGEGGELPGHKVDEIIAKTRHSTPGVGLISPPPHHDIYSIEDLAQLIFDLKNANPSARVSVKLVSEVGVGTVAAGVAKGHADHILISGHDGGTGASPLTSIKHAGLPWELGIAETHQTLVLNDLRSRVVLQTDGQMKTGRDVAIGFLLGAEEIGFSTAPLITLGCIMMRKCHLNTCPVGVATQDPELRKKFTGKPEHVVNYLFMVAEDCRQVMADIGVRTVNEMIGRVDALEADEAIGHFKAKGLDLSPILQPAIKPHENVDVYCMIKQDHAMEDILDHTLIKKCQSAINDCKKVSFSMDIKNTNRTTGTMLSHEISKKWEDKGLPEDTIHIKFSGSAGQSLGAWLASGVTLEVEGDANDYVGKGLSGGRLIIYPSHSATFVAEENIIIGNVALYGAVQGQAFFRGMCAERFCVRNSGATAVIEGVGDHACEYMTGGRAVILGPTGRNFAAGMSGGIAYVHDPNDALELNCNLATVAIERLEDRMDVEEIFNLIKSHEQLTGSPVANRILKNWDKALGEFVKVMPTDYKRVLAERMSHDEEDDAPVHDGQEVHDG